MFTPSRSQLKRSHHLKYHLYVLHYIAILFGLSNLSYNHATKSIEMSNRKMRNVYHKAFIIIVFTSTVIYECILTVSIISSFQTMDTIKAQELILLMLYFQLACISSLIMLYNLKIRRGIIIELLQRLNSLRRHLKHQNFNCWHEEKLYVGFVYLRWISVVLMLPNSNMMQILRSDCNFVFHGSYYIIIYEICYHAYFMHNFIALCSYKILNKFFREKFNKRKYSDLAKVTDIYYCLDHLMNMGVKFAPFLLCIFSRFLISAVELYQNLKCALFAPNLQLALRLQKFGWVLPIMVAQFLEVLLLSHISDDLLTEKQIFMERLSLASTKLVALRKSTRKVKKLEAQFDMTTLFSKLSTYEISAYNAFTFSRRTILDYVNIIVSITIPSLQYFVYNCYKTSNREDCDVKCVWGGPE